MEVSRQKGKIDPTMRTMKTITPKERALEDNQMRMDRKKGQEFASVMSPKTGKK